MKQYLTLEDLNSLTFSQKQALKLLWLPAVNDRAVASVCKDAENDIYEDLEFVVGEVIISERGTITLKRLRMPEELTDDEEIPANEEESPEEVFYDVFDPGDYFLKENCLPLFNIGQLINCLRNTKAGQGGFSLDIPPASGIEAEEGYRISDRFGEVDRDDELIDLLFKILKEQL
ncbi:MAG TPA: hypothetical protein GXZ22_07975 [Clostridiaceae bacterium]|jgi:hypothetical protein|nr:hypothetical protein [Clostridiaceae bacterium]